MGYWKNQQFLLQEAALSGVTLNKAGEAIDLDLAAAKLGGEVSGDFILCPSPGRGPDDRTMQVRLAACSKPYVYACEGPLGRAYALMREALELVDQPGTDNTGSARRLWDETIPVTPGAHVARYLQARAITLPVPPCLRYHPQCWHSGTRSHWCAMVAERTDVTGTWAAIHRTYLSSEAKAPCTPNKMDLGSAKGTAIRLSPVCEELMVGEGIETTLAAMQMEGGFPGWAAGSAVAMRLMVLPPEVRSVIILADGEDIGRQAARYAATRWQREGRRVRIAYAPEGKDFNDVLRERGT